MDAAGGKRVRLEPQHVVPAHEIFDPDSLYEEEMYDDIISELREMQERQQADRTRGIRIATPGFLKIFDIQGILSPLCSTNVMKTRWPDATDTPTSLGQTHPLSATMLQRANALPGKGISISDLEYDLAFLGQVCPEIPTTWFSSTHVNRAVRRQSQGDVLWMKVRAAALETQFWLGPEQDKPVGMVMAEDFLHTPEALILAGRVFDHLRTVDGIPIPYRLMSADKQIGLVPDDMDALEKVPTDLGVIASARIVNPHRTASAAMDMDL